jgi:hypothetical protein
MAYEVHITRTNHRGKSDSNPITLEEWIAYARSDAELRFEGGVVEAISPKGEKIRMKTPGRTRWTRPGTGDSVWFHHGPSGRVSVRRPDRETLVKMFQVAAALGACVRGDDGETYDAAGRVSGRD